MAFAKFDQFLREVLKLPTAVFEGPSFGYTEHSVRTCFPQQVGHSNNMTSYFKIKHFMTFKCDRKYVSLCFHLEEDHVEHLLGRVDGRSSASVSGVAATHAPTG